MLGNHFVVFEPELPHLGVFEKNILDLHVSANAIKVIVDSSQVLHLAHDRVLWNRELCSLLVWLILKKGYESDIVLGHFLGLYHLLDTFYI